MNRFKSFGNKGAASNERPKLNLEAVKNFAAKYENNPKKAIAHLWYLSLVWVGLIFIVAISVAASNGASATGSSSAGFAAIWMMLLLILISVGGTIIMRKYQTPLAIGFFLGIVVMASQTMFTLFVLFAGFASVATDEAAADRWFSAISFFLFITYGAFAVFLAKYRTEIVEEEATEKDTYAVQQNLAGAAKERLDIFGKEKAGIVGHIPTSKGTPV
mmetsp:Transcript_38806/g.51133  ORF Transcript_38806/g.51133 Transcript_38806/m.51133 type:complete len:217 (+) Transcript_38806:80-730(+)